MTYSNYFHSYVVKIFEFWTLCGNVLFFCQEDEIKVAVLIETQKRGSGRADYKHHCHK